MTSKPLYAYATKNEDGTLVITHELDEESKFENHYRIPVSASKETIAKRGTHLTQGELEHTLVDISPLIEAGVVPKENVLDLDMQTRSRFYVHS